MCVTLDEAEIENTETYALVTDQVSDLGPIHVVGYQNVAKSIRYNAGPNCMMLNFPARRNLQLVNGAQFTTNLMADMTLGLPTLQEVRRSRSAGLLGGGYDFGVTVHDYGDFSIALAQGPADMFSEEVMSQIPRNRRIVPSSRVRERNDFYMSYTPEDAFLMCFWDGAAKPKHPIVVSYTPRNPNVITIPGLDGHDGNSPRPGTPVHRGFKVAIGVAGAELPIRPRYRDNVDGKFWVPQTVTGFHDNRHTGPNEDYVIPIDDVLAGKVGPELAAALVSG